VLDHPCQHHVEALAGIRQCVGGGSRGSRFASPASRRAVSAASILAAAGSRDTIGVQTRQRLAQDAGAAADVEEAQAAEASSRLAIGSNFRQAAAF